MVEWEDATVLDDSAWCDKTEHNYKPKHFISVGFLLHESKQGVILTSAWSLDMVAARDQIPKGMIRKMTRLKA